MPRISKNALTTMENRTSSALASASRARKAASAAPLSAGLTQFAATLVGGAGAGAANARMGSLMGSKPSFMLGLISTGAALAAWAGGNGTALNSALGVAGGLLAVSAAEWAEDKVDAMPAPAPTPAG